MLPFTEANVPEVDLQAGRIVVAMPEESEVGEQTSARSAEPSGD